MSELPKNIKNYDIRGPDIGFEVKYHWNGWVKKDGVNAYLVLREWLNFRYPQCTELDSAVSSF